jgi:hypothetical protein
METARSSETLVITYKTTKRNNSEDHNSNFHRRKNLKSHAVFFFTSIVPTCFLTLLNIRRIYYLLSSLLTYDRSSVLLSHLCFRLSGYGEAQNVSEIHRIPLEACSAHKNK